MHRQYHDEAEVLAFLKFNDNSQHNDASHLHWTHINTLLETQTVRLSSITFNNLHSPC